MLEFAVTLSGGGRTVLNFLDRIEAGDLDARIVLAVADRACNGIERLAQRGLSVEVIPWPKGTAPEEYAAWVWPRIEAAGADLVCFCGFLRLLLIPSGWENRVMNIHPALLPKFGGKGMWGDHVHRAVLEAGDRESGCSVHFADNRYDKGPIILQKRVPVLPDDTAESLAARVFRVECEAYPEAVRLYGEGRLRVEHGKVIIR
ncbi:MAG: phosphoribosylglycinamide formyltransferase [Planctomycetota bacterium]|jgi:phosphoribosylglycinamide formyltransferase-1